MMIGTGALGKWLSYEGRITLSVISALIKETLESSPAPFTLEGFVYLEEGPHLAMPAPSSWIPGSRTMGKKCYNFL